MLNKLINQLERFVAWSGRNLNEMSMDEMIQNAHRLDPDQ